MKKLFCIALLALLAACNDDPTTSTTTPETPAVAAQAKQDFSSIKQFDIINSGFREYQGHPAAWVMFSKPVNGKVNLNKFIELSDKQGLLDGAWQLDDAGNNAYYLDISPAHQYTVRVNVGLTSYDQQTLNTGSKKTFTSPDVVAGATFLHQGSILNPDFSDGLPVMVVNVPWVDVEFYRVKPEHYREFIDDNPTSKKYSWTLDNQSSYSEFVSSQKYDTSAQKNKKIKKVLATNHIDALKEPGLYLAIMRMPGKYENYQFAHFNVSTLATEVREYKDSYLVSVIEQNSGKPASNVEVSIVQYDSKKTIETLSTDENGQVHIDKKLKPYLIALTKESNFNLLRLGASSLDLTDFSIGGTHHKPLELFIFGPRDLYRRGEHVTYYALLRDLDGKPVKQLPIPTKLYDPNGNEIASSLSKVSNGLYQFDHQFAADALTGEYHLSFNIGDEYYKKGFSVEDFMPERMEIEIDQATAPLTKAGDASQSLTGLFLYGAPASQHKVDGMVQVKTTANALKELPGFYFGQHQDIGTLDSYELSEIRLDDDGVGSLNLDDRWSNRKQALNIQGYAYLYETGGRKVTKKFNQLWWPQESLIGIKPQFEKLTSDSEQDVAFQLVRSDANAQLLGDTVMVSLIRHHQEYYWQYSRHEGWQRHQRNDVYPVWQKELTLDKDQPLTIKVPVAWGKYQLTVHSTTDNSKAQLFFDAGERWYWYWSDNNANSVRPDQIKLALDKASYQDGDQAKVKIDAPYAGSAWLRIESDQLLWQQQITLNKGQNNVTIPIKDWQRHDVYLSAYLVSPATKTEPLKRALGLSHIALNRQNRALDVTINAPTKVKPDNMVPLTVNIANASEQTQVVLAGVDVGILNLHQFKTPEPLAHFFGKRRYNVDIQDNFSRIIAPNQLNKADILWGGGAELARGGEEAQSKVQIVSYLSKPTKVDSNGDAHFELPVPYFNGRMRIFAIAYDKQRFGSSEQKLTVADDLVSQINMPRFLAVGDQTIFKLDLTNTTDKTLDLTVAIAANDLALAPTPSNITLAAGKKATLPLAISAKQVASNASVSLKVSGENIDVDRSWPITVRPAYPAQRIVTSTLLEQHQSHQFSLNAPHWSDQTQSSISIATRPQFDLTDQVSRLYQFPLGCLEQTSSRLYPWLVLPPTTQTELSKTLSQVNKEQLISDGIKRILSLQRHNGSLSLWHSDGRENPWLSAYGAQVLLQAQQNGIYVDQTKIEKLLKRLSYYLRRANFSSDNGEHYRFATRSYSALVLAQLGRANQSHMRQLLKSKRHAKSPLPVVQLAIAFKLMGDIDRSDTLIDMAMIMPYKQRYDSTYGTKIRDKAMIINLLLQHDVAKTWAQKLSFELWDQVQTRRWFSTQERLSLVLADHQLAKHFDVDFDYKLAVAATTFTGPDNMSAFYRVDGEAFNQTRLTNTTAPSLYVNTISQGYPKNPPPYQEDGLTVRRDYYNIKGQPINVSTVNSGERILVRIRAQGLEDSFEDIMVVDLLPAGFEIERGNLDEQLDIHQVSIDGSNLYQRISNHRIDYQGYRDDRYIASISVSKRRETELYYIVQAVTPGTYVLPPVMAESMYRDDIRAVGESSLLKIIVK